MCQLTGCFIVTCVRVKVLTVLLTLSSKPQLSSEAPPHSGLYVSVNPCSALYTVPNYAKSSMKWKEPPLYDANPVSARKEGWERRGWIIRNLVRFPFPLPLVSVSPCFICMFQKGSPITEAVPPTASPSATRGESRRECEDMRKRKEFENSVS